MTQYCKENYDGVSLALTRKIFLVFFALQLIGCRSKDHPNRSGNDSSATTTDPGGTEPAPEGGVSGHVEDNKVSSDDFAPANQPVPISGTNLLDTDLVGVDAISFGDGGVPSLSHIADVGLNDNNFAIKVPLRTYFLVSHGGLTAVVPTLQKRVDQAEPAIGVVINLAATATSNLFNKLSATHPVLVQNQHVDLAGLLDLGAAVARANRRLPGVESDAALSELADTFATANEDLIGNLTASGITSEEAALSLAQAIQAQFDPEVIAAQVKAGSYDQRRTALATIKSFRDFLPVNFSPDAQLTRTSDRVFEAIAKDPSSVEKHRPLLQEKAYVEQLDRIQEVLTKVESSTGNELKQAVWNAISKQSADNLSALVTHQNVGQTSVDELIKKITETEGDPEAVDKLIKSVATVPFVMASQRTQYQSHNRILITATPLSPTTALALTLTNAAGAAIFSQLTNYVTASTDAYRTEFIPPAAVNIWLYPRSLVKEGQLTYGANTLALDVGGGFTSQTATFVLRDVAVQGMATTTGSLGWISDGTGVGKSADGSTLTHGVVGIIKQ